jgi:carbamoyl-phosphate synthase large subunit
MRIDRGLKVVAGDMDPMAIARFEADEFWQMPRLTDNILSELIESCRIRSISIVLPSRDGELDFWARHRPAFLEAGIEVIVSSPEAIARCRDKLAFARFGHNIGLPMIPTDKTPDGFGGVRFVVKERFGAGSRGIGLNLDYQQAVEHAKGLDEPVFQPFVPGPEISIDGWVSTRGQVVGVVLRCRDLVVSGESQVTTTFRDAALEREAIQILTALQLRGPVVLQAIVVDGKLQVIECNPRFGGASTASIAAGLDSLYWSLAEAMGDTACPDFHRISGEARQIRMSVDRVIYGSDF